MYKFIDYLLRLLVCSVILLNLANAQSDQVVRIRGSVIEVKDNNIIFKERAGEVISIAFGDSLNIQEVYPISMSNIERNSFIGTAALADKTGRLIALEVHVFPESMRGTGEGHRAWDSVPGSTMTNANVDELISVGNSRELRLKYKGGEKIVFVPESVPVVTYKPGSTDLLVPGANAIITASDKSGRPTASRIVIGRDSFKPPM